MQRRRRFKHQITLRDRLALWAEKVRQQASELSPGPERNALLNKISKAEAAARIDNWANSTGLQPPK